MWFTKKKKGKKELVNNQSSLNAIEIVAHKNATREVIAEAKQANQKLNDLLVENGFTLKIYLAAGGTHPAQKTKRNH